MRLVVVEGEVNVLVQRKQCSGILPLGDSAKNR